MPIPWTDKEKKSLQPTRSFAAVAPSARSLKRLQKAFHGKGEGKRSLAKLRTGLAIDVEPELRALREAAFKLIENKNVDLDAIKLASTIELAAAETMFMYGDRPATLTDAVVLARGVADAVAMRIEMRRFGLAAEPNWTVAVFLTEAPNRRRLDGSTPYWLPLRHAVCSAPPEEYEAAKKVVMAAWEDLNVDERANLAYVFPDEPWGTEILESPASATTKRGAFGGMPTQVQAFGFLLSTCHDANVVKAYLAQGGGSFWVSKSALELVLLLPKDDAAKLFMETIPTLLIKKKYQTFHKTPPRDVLTALMKIDDARVPAFVASYVGHKVLGALAALYFQECPEARDVLKKGNASAQRLFDSLGQATGDDTELAPDSDVPVLLRGCDWRLPKDGKKTPTVRGLLVTASGEERVISLEGVEPLTRGPQKLPPLEGEGLNEWRESIARGRAATDIEHRYPEYTRYAVPPDEGLAAWNTGRGNTHDVCRFVAEHGLACIPGFLLDTRLRNLDYEGAEAWIIACQSLDTPRMALLWARVFCGRKKWRATARRWLRTDARRAADGLVPAAFGGKGREKKDAEAALRDLIRAGESDTLRAAATTYGKDAAAAMEVFLARDPLVIDAKPPKLPGFLSADQLPSLITSDGKLSDEHRGAFIELLSIAEPSYPGYAQLREGLEASSLESFVLALVDTWARQGGPGRHDWMLRAALAFPTDNVVRAVCGHARAWARSKGASAQRTCSALAYLGAVHESDVAALHLAHIAATTRFVALRKEAAEHLEDIARARGLTRDELDDRSTPDLGLDASGKLTLSFGEITVEVQPTEGLGVVLRKDDEVICAFPRVAKSAPEEEKLEHKKAKAHYDAFKKDLAAIRVRQVRRLENSMASGRAWSLAEAKRYFFEHPLAQHLARGLVWMSDEGQAFRFTQDGTFADVDDEEVSVTGNVRIAHILELEDDDAWTAAFVDYELVQPVIQLARPKEALTAAEKKKGEVKRHSGTKLNAAKIMGFLESRGWRRDSTNHISAFSKLGRDGATFTLKLKGSIEMEYLSSGEKVEIGVLHMEGEASAVSASEALYDLASLCG